MVLPQSAPASGVCGDPVECNQVKVSLCAMTSMVYQWESKRLNLIVIVLLYFLLLNLSSPFAHQFQNCIGSKSSFLVGNNNILLLHCLFITSSFQRRAL